MTSKEIQQHILDQNTAFIAGLKTKQERSEAASFLLYLGFEITKGIEGREFLRGWLDSVIHDINTNSDDLLVIKEMH